MTTAAESQAREPTMAALGLTGKKVLLAASTGGHLAELHRLLEFVEPSPDSLVVTFDSAQSRSYADAHRMHVVPYIKPRDLRAVIAVREEFRRLMRAENWDAVLSTGAAIALSALPQASRSTRAIYVESYSRFAGPSLTGRVLRRVAPSVELYSQHRSYADRRWRYSGSILDGIRSPTSRPGTVRNRIFVTLGTIEPYRFDALVDRVLQVAPTDAEFVWQLGSTMRPDLPGQVHRHLDRGAFLHEADQASVVVSHAGVATALELIEMGHRPILVAREADRGEHVDDHQTQIVDDLGRRGLVVGRRVDELAREDLRPLVA